MHCVRALTLMIILTFLCSCAGKGEDEALLLRTKYLQASSVSANADITADYGDEIYNFSVKFIGKGDDVNITVIAPEEIAGITASITEDGASVEFDGTEFSLGVLDGEVVPAAAPSLLLNQWKNGYITQRWTEGLDGERAACFTTQIEDDLTQSTWFDENTLLPVKAEIYSDGKMIIKCIFTDVEIT